MERSLPQTPAEWLEEIKLAIIDASEAKQRGILVGDPIREIDFFHWAPLVCLKFRGHEVEGAAAQRVRHEALWNYVINTDPDGIDHGLEQNPLLAFCFCYVAAHYALHLVDEQQADTILTYCKRHLDELGTG